MKDMNEMIRYMTMYREGSDYYNPLDVKWSHRMKVRCKLLKIAGLSLRRQFELHGKSEGRIFLENIVPKWI
jgi:hypothetical protein